MDADAQASDLQSPVVQFLRCHDPAATGRVEFLRARYDAGLAWVHFPVGHGGLGYSRALQPEVDEAFNAAAVPDNRPHHNGIGLGMAAPTILAFGTRSRRQITGEAEFNEVFLTDVRIADDCRLGDEGAGWKVATATLNNERVSIGASVPRESGMIGSLAAAWRANRAARSTDLHARLMRLWVDADANRIAGERLRQRLAAGEPGPEGSVMKLNFARIAQEASGLELELLGDEGLRFYDWAMERPITSISPATTPAIATCARKATRSRAEPRRSCAMSSPSASCACPPSPVPTPASRGRTSPVDRP